jgi:arginyl-tRNA synthetase
MFQDRLHALLVPAFTEAFNALYGKAPDAKMLVLQATRPEFEGDVTINVFPFLKLSGQGPEATATAIGEHLKDRLDVVARFNVVKGFLNLAIADHYWLDFLAGAGEDLLQCPPGAGQVMVEYASPNTNKPLHLGHARNIFLGDAVCRILQTAGHDVVRVQVVNDRGIHICKSMVAWQLEGHGETPESSGLKGDKLVGKYYVVFDRLHKAQMAELSSGGMPEEEAAKQTPVMRQAQEMLRQWEAGDPQVRDLWKRMNQWVYTGFNATYHRMGVGFDRTYYESDTYLLGKQDVLDGLERGVFFRKPDGSVWVDNTPEGLDEKVLMRGDGTSLYMTQDIGTAAQRFKEFPGLGRMIYTVGNEQDYHFKVLFLILRKLGHPWAAGLHHLSYGMVDLPTGKMKSREGTVVDADELMEEMVQEARRSGEELSKLDDLSEAEKNVLFEQIGMAALKYFLLKVDPKKRMLFDPKASIDLHGHTGPFIQYTHARIRSLIRKAGERWSEDRAPLSDAETTGMPEQRTTGNHRLLPEERAVIKLLHHAPAVLNDAAAKLDPSVLANHAYELVKAYNNFYQNVPILKETDDTARGLRLRLSAAVAATVKKAMWCLGMEVPERM